MLLSNPSVSSKLVTRFGAILLSTCVAFAASTSGVQAAVFNASGPNTFNGNNTALAATANFTASGNTLTVVLTNTGTGFINDASSVLTGVFFNFSGVPPVTLTTVGGSALLNGSTVTPGGTAPVGGNVGGEWAYSGSLGSGAPAPYGISSSGLGFFGQPNFNGLNLQNPTAVDGINYGIVNTAYVNGQGNGGINSTPLIRNAVTFTLSGLPVGFSDTSISNVQFQYGTSLAETRLVGVNPDAVPEPSSAIGMLFLGSMGGAAALKRKKTLAR
jgi:hypothetical protein